MIKAIQTEYRGYRFRSRLEARWAVFFDLLGITWQYELEGYDLGNGRLYLPDFHLDGIGWVEIKGKATEDPIIYCALAEDTGELVYLFEGMVPAPDEVSNTGPDQFDGDFTITEYAPRWEDYYYWFCVCEKCGAVGIQFNARAARVCKDHMDGDKGYNGNHPRILAALKAARGARFEHGEKP